MDIPSSDLKSRDISHFMKYYINEVIYLYIEKMKFIERLTILYMENNELLFLVPVIIKRVADLRKKLEWVMGYLKKEELQKKLRAGDEIEFNNASEDNNLLESVTDDVATGAGEDSPLGDDFNLAEEDD